MKLFFFGSLIFLIGVQSQALSCRGEVPVLENQFKSAVTVFLKLNSLEDIVPGYNKISLGNPITQDTENIVPLQVIHSQKEKQGVHVILKDESNLLFLSFEVRLQGNSLTLVGFRGFEGPLAFGPADLSCEND